MTDALWYFGRGAGVSALVLFSVVTALGATVVTGRPLPGLPRFTVTDLHRTLSLTAVGFLLVHMVTLLADPYAQLRPADLLLPFLGRYRPLWQGLGTLALDLVVLLVVSSLLRHRLGLRVWRALHWTAYSCWPFAIAHALGNGTDRSSWWLLTLVAGCVLLVVVTVARRAVIASGPNRRPARPVAAPLDLARPR